MEEAEYIKFLQMKRQADNPFMPLVNAAQVWMSSNNHLYTRLHQQEDPGADNVWKIADFLYATFFGRKETAIAADTVAIDAEGINGVYCELDQDVEFTIGAGAEWQRLYMVLKQDATGGRVASFGAGFGTIGNKTAGVEEYSIISLIYDDENGLWHEMAGGGGNGGGEVMERFLWW